MDKDKFILELRQHINEFNGAMAELRERRRVWGTQDFTNTLQQSELTGANEKILVSDLINAMTTIDDLDSFIASGHGTNLDRLLM